MGRLLGCYLRHHNEKRVYLSKTRTYPSDEPTAIHEGIKGLIDMAVTAAVDSELVVLINTSLLQFGRSHLWLLPGRATNTVFFRFFFTITVLNKAQIMVSLFLCSFGSDVLSGVKVSEGLFHRHCILPLARVEATEETCVLPYEGSFNLSLMQILKWLFSDKMPAESSCVSETGLIKFG